MDSVVPVTHSRFAHSFLHYIVAMVSHRNQVPKSTAAVVVTDDATRVLPPGSLCQSIALLVNEIVDQLEREQAGKSAKKPVLSDGAEKQGLKSKIESNSLHLAA